MTEGVLKEVAQERIRQDEKWGIQNHEPASWLSILGEEFGEVCRAVCERLYAVGPNPEYREELIHVAAVAVEMIECYDRKLQNLVILPNEKCCEKCKYICETKCLNPDQVCAEGKYNDYPGFEPAEKPGHIPDAGEKADPLESLAGSIGRVFVGGLRGDDQLNEVATLIEADRERVRKEERELVAKRYCLSCASEDNIICAEGHKCGWYRFFLDPNAKDYVFSEEDRTRKEDIL